MPARRLLPLLALGLAAACGRGADSTGAATTTSTLPAGPGVHDHTPHHGGVVGMAGDLHLEALAAPDGRVRVYLTDFWRRPLPAASATGTVTLELPDRDRALPLAVAGDALEGSGPALHGAEVTAHVALSVGGKAVEMDFVLPVGAGGAGAAGVPVHGCVALAGSPGAARAPRCTLDFAHPVTVVAATPDGALALVAAVDLGVSAWRLPAGQLALAFAPPPPLVVPGPEGLQPHPESANDVAVRPDGSEAVVAREGRLLRYSTRTGRLARELAAPRGVLRSVAWSPDGATLLVTAFYDPSAHLVRAEDGRELRRFPVEREGAGVAFAAGGRQVAVGSELGSVALYPVDADTPSHLLAAAPGPASVLVFAGGRLLAGGTDGVLRVFDAESGALVAEGPPGTGITRLAAAPGAGLVASAHNDGSVRVSTLPDATVVTTLAWHTHQLLGLAWAGSVLVSGDTAGHVALWDVGDLVAGRF